MKGEEVGRAEEGPRGASRAWGRVCTGFRRQQEPLEGSQTHLPAGAVVLLWASRPWGGTAEVFPAEEMQSWGCSTLAPQEGSDASWSGSVWPTVLVLGCWPSTALGTAGGSASFVVRWGLRLEIVSAAHPAPPGAVLQASSPAHPLPATLPPALRALEMVCVLGVAPVTGPKGPRRGAVPEDPRAGLLTSSLPD